MDNPNIQQGAPQAPSQEPQAQGNPNPAVSPNPAAPAANPSPTAGNVADPMAAAAQAGEGQAQKSAIDDPMAAAANAQGGNAQQGENQQQSAPEKYEAFKMGDSEISEEATTAFAELAKKHNLSQEEAQEFVNSFAPAVQAQVQGYQRQWLDACRSDKELGGEHFNENMAVAGAGYRAYADNDLRAVFEASGLSRHPAVVRHFYRLGKNLQQDKGVAGGASAPAPVKRLYPNSGMVPDIKQ